MPDWKSQDEITKDGLVFAKLIHVLFGLYLWEFVTSMGFDVQMFLGRRRFRWPLIFYFAGRYSLLFALVGIIIALNVTSPINCQALYIFDQIFGNAAIGLASINLSLRTMAVWSQSLYVVIPLVLIILGHWSLLLHGLLIKAAWIPGAGCQITNTSNKILAATFVYSMAFDFTVLCLTAIKLFFPRSRRSHLVNLIFRDGLIFFIVAFLANLLATIFMIMNLNPVMSIIFNVPAAVASTIVASRAVRRLSAYADAQVRGNVPPCNRPPRPIVDHPAGGFDLHDMRDTGERCWRCKMREEGVLEDNSYENDARTCRKKKGGFTLGIFKNLRGGLSLSDNTHSGGKMGVDVRGPAYTSTLAFRGVDDFTSMGTSLGSGGTSSGAFVISGTGSESLPPSKLLSSSITHARHQNFVEHHTRPPQGILDITEEKDEDISPISNDTKDNSPSTSFPPALLIPELSPVPPAPVTQTMRVHLSNQLIDEGVNGKRIRHKRGSRDGRFEGDMNFDSHIRTPPSVPPSHSVLADVPKPTSRTSSQIPQKISHEGFGNMDLETREPGPGARKANTAELQSPVQESTRSTITLLEASSSTHKETVSPEDSSTRGTVPIGFGHTDHLDLLLGEEDDLSATEDYNGNSGNQSLPHSRPRSRLSSSASRRLGPIGAAEKILGIGVSMRPSSPSSSHSLSHSRLYSRPQISPTPPPSASPHHSIMDGYGAPFRPSSPSRSDHTVELRKNHLETRSSASSLFRTGTILDHVQDSERRNATPPPRTDGSHRNIMDDATESSNYELLTSRRSFNRENNDMQGTEAVNHADLDGTEPRRVEYDASGNIIHEGMGIDYEAQEISWEFRRPPY